MDAMGCRKEIAADLRAQGADDVLAVKDNQPTLHEDVRVALEADAEDSFQASEVKQCRIITAGRRDVRTDYVAPVPQAVTNRDEWKDVQSMGWCSASAKAPRTARADFSSAACRRR